MSGGNCPGGNCPGGNCPDTLYFAPHFDVHIWLQVNTEKTNDCKSRIFEIQVFVFDYRQISTRRTFENVRF